MSLTTTEVKQLQVFLQEAVAKCSERCLYHSAKWAAELLGSIPENLTLDNPNPDSDAMPPTLTVTPDWAEIHLETKEISDYLLAKSLFDCGELERCAEIFLPRTASSGSEAVPSSFTQSRTLSKGKEKVSKSKPMSYRGSGQYSLQISQRSLFLALYATFLAGERRMKEESQIVLGPLDGGATVNKELLEIICRLDAWFKERQGRDGKVANSQGWLEYLYGIALAKSKNGGEAIKWLLRSVNIYPWNWGAWQELSALISNVDQLDQIQLHLTPSIMAFIFFINIRQELYQSTLAVHRDIDQVEDIFPNSLFIKTQRALLYYHDKGMINALFSNSPRLILSIDFSTAESIFSHLVVADPRCIDFLDHYSNILYVMKVRPKLAFISQLSSSIDRFRPETCCVVGNYYSQLSQHEKAIGYFRQALTLDRNFPAAWTLLGHEYLEIKNTHAAIQSYRNAVDLNCKDYRAWYGLGRTYELLEMYYYALFYFRRAAALRPNEHNIWQSISMCLSKVDRPAEAIKALKQTLVVTSAETLDPEILYQVAKLYEQIHNRTEAIAFMELCLAQEERLDNEMAGEKDSYGLTVIMSSARMSLARWAVENGDLRRAYELAGKVGGEGVDKEEAVAMLRNLRTAIESDDVMGRRSCLANPVHILLP